MRLVNFDGYIPYDEDSFQTLVKDLKAETDKADAAYKAIDDDLKAYIALLAFNNLYVIMHDKARLRAFVQNQLKATVKGGGKLPGDEIEAAIDAVYLSMFDAIERAAGRIEGQKPQIEFAWGIRVDKGPGMIIRPHLATVLFQAQNVALAMSAYQKGTLRPAITAEYRRARGILNAAESACGSLGVALPGDPLADAAKLPAALAAVGQKAAQKHAGLLEFRRFAEAALSRMPDAKPDDVIQSFSVTAASLPLAAALRSYWATLMGLSAWLRTANLLSVANQAGFVMRARIVYLLAKGEEPTDWTDSYAVGSTRKIDLSAQPKRMGQRFQVEVDAAAGATERGEVMFHSMLAAPDVVEISVRGTTLSFAIEAQ